MINSNKKYNSIHENIRKIRKDSKLTQEQFGSKISKSKNTIKKYESGTINIPMKVLNLIINTFDVNWIDLLGQDLNSYLIENYDSIIDLFEIKITSDEINKFTKYLIELSSEEPEEIVINYSLKYPNINIYFESFNFDSSSYSFSDINSIPNSILLTLDYLFAILSLKNSNLIFKNICDNYSEILIWLSLKPYFSNFYTFFELLSYNTYTTSDTLQDMLLNSFIHKYKKPLFKNKNINLLCENETSYLDKIVEFYKLFEKSEIDINNIESEIMNIGLNNFKKILPLNILDTVIDSLKDDMTIIDIVNMHKFFDKDYINKTKDFNSKIDLYIDLLQKQKK